MLKMNCNLKNFVIGSKVGSSRLSMEFKINKYIPFKSNNLWQFIFRN